MIQCLFIFACCIVLNVELSLLSPLFFPKDLTICLCKDLDLTNSTWRTVPWTCLRAAMGRWGAIITRCHPRRVCPCRIRWLWARGSRWATMVPDQTWTCNQTKVNEVPACFHRSTLFKLYLVFFLWISFSKCPCPMSVGSYNSVLQCANDFLFVCGH